MWSAIYKLLVIKRISPSSNLNVKNDEKHHERGATPIDILTPRLPGSTRRNIKKEYGDLVTDAKIDSCLVTM